MTDPRVALSSRAMAGPAVPLISIIIPTRERLGTLRSTVSTALDQQSDRIEVLVADNASSDGTAEFVSSVQDPRLRYISSGQRLSMSANWELALEHARGDYILIVGDDDAVFPGAIDRLIQDMARDPAEVYVWPKHVYVWPGQGRDAYVESIAPQTSPRWIDLGRLSSSVMRMGSWRYYALPSMYHSLVSRRIPDSIRKQHGRVYHSTAPDVFMSLCIPALTDRARDVGYSVTAHGRSPKSNGWLITIKEEPEQIQQFVGEYGDYQIHPTLYPDIPILANLAPDSVLRARDLFIDHYRSVPFGYEAMWAVICRDASAFKWSVTPLDVIRQRMRIRRYHALKLPLFISLLAVHFIAEVRARLLRRRKSARGAASIVEFVHEVARH